MGPVAQASIRSELAGVGLRPQLQSLLQYRRVYQGLYSSTARYYLHGQTGVDMHGTAHEDS